MARFTAVKDSQIVAPAIGRSRNCPYSRGEPQRLVSYADPKKGAIAVHG